MMNHDPAPGQVDVSTGHIEGERLLVEGRHREALELFAAAVREHPEDGEALDGASRAFCELVRDGSIGGVLDSSAREALYRALILQEVCPVAPPVLHHMLAGRHTSGDTEAIAKTADELSPVLRRLKAEGKVNAPYVLMLLLLRNSIGGWISQEEISRLHVEWFSRFRLADLGLPYSCMFNEAQFGPNRDDLAAVFRDPAEAARRLPGLTLVQAVFLEWLLEIDLFGRHQGDRLRKLLGEKLAVDQALPEEQAAARSLVVVHGLGGQEAEPADLRSLGLAPEIAELVNSVREAREAIRAKSPGFSPSSLVHRRPWQAYQAARNLAAAKVPVLGRLRRKPRVALCVSGQLRGYRAAFPTWKRTLLAVMDCDIFVHSWIKVGRSTAEPYRYVLPFEGERFREKYREICLKLGFETFCARYPGLIKRLAETGYVTEAEVASFYQTDHVKLIDETLPPCNGWSNAEKMYSKIEACHQMIVDSGREYDLIIRLRPDLPVRLVAFDPREILKNCRDRPLIYADSGFGQHYAHPLIGDQMAIGAPGPMRVYAQTRTIYPKLAEARLLQTVPVYQGHSSVAQVCWVHGIRVEKAPIKFGTLQEPTPLGSGEIREALRLDSSGRDDWTDRQLLEAVEADLNAGA